MSDIRPLYNSRIFKVSLDGLCTMHPGLDVREILERAGMSAAALTDAAHWFSQDQADRFHEVVVEQTGDDNIARKAGRCSVSTAGLPAIRRFALGLLNTESALLALVGKFPLLTRGVAVEAERLGPGRIEIRCTPKPGVAEKPYQCDNRVGVLEALPKIFTDLYGRVEHPSCCHKGDGACCYVVSWETPPSLKIKVWFYYAVLTTLVLAPLAYVVLPAGLFLPLLAALLGLNGLLGLRYLRLKIEALEKIVEKSSLAAQERIERAHTNYNNALLAQEIGQATAAILNVDELMHKLATLMSRRLDFDRGLIMLADATGTRLVYAAGYGYSAAERHYLERAAFRLDNPASKGFFVRTFLDRRHMILTNVNELMERLSPKSRELIAFFNVRALLCIPIVYKESAIGVLAVDNVTSKIPLKQSDINLLEGIAAQIAISVNNARSFQKCRESENRYRQTLESIEEGYFELDANRQLLLVNEAFGRLVGRPPEQLPGSAFDGCFVPGSAVRLGLLFGRMVGSREPVRFAQLELPGPGGAKLPVDLSVSLIVDGNDRVAGFRGLLRDATDRLHLERERKDLEYKLLRAQKLESIGTLSGGIAHNFNNFLAGILGNAALIRMAANGQAKVSERITRIEHIVESAAKMTRQLLGYARGGARDKHPIVLNALVKEVADTFASSHRDVTIQLSLDQDLRSVEADKSQIEQVLWNLFVNAVDAMPGGGVLKIGTANVEADKIERRPADAPPGACVLIRCTDSGTGIAPEDLDKIFEPFFTTKQDKGTGLGLASCFGIVRAHGGFIDVASEIGAGSTFNIYLPAAGEPSICDDAPVLRARKGRGTILVVDDEEMVLETFAQLLEGLGYTVLSAASGDDALKCFAERLEAIDLVIIDMIMPGMNGQECHARIKKLKPDVKTILCSGYSMNRRIQSVMRDGCDCFLQKPFTLAQASTAIKGVLAGRR